MKHTNLDKLLEIMQNLPVERVNEIVGEMYEKILSYSNRGDTSVYALYSSEKNLCCKHCGSINFVKNGTDRNRHTRYLCKDCKRTFSDITGTVVSGTHYDACVWKQYIHCMINGYSLAKCSEKCSISLPTAFQWRHKIINSLSKNAFIPTLVGTVEMDEMFIRLSYKGNHSKNSSFSLPRKAYVRGSDNRPIGNNERACVLCMAERRKSYSGAVVCRGTINKYLLQDLFEDRVSDDTIVLTDGWRAYNQYFCTTNAEHIVLPTNNKKPTVKGPYHINNVNALHSRFRKFLYKYNGVSTKYLNNYLSFFIWLENHGAINVEQLIINEMSRNGSYVTYEQLRDRSPVPELAPAVA